MFCARRLKKRKAMGNVIGPIDAETWFTMRQLSEGIKDLRSRKDPKYDVAMHGYQDVLNSFYDKVFGREAA